ncbi:pollen-specific leucine-rich repeat extensin-like protein 4 [Iris pallida]|uniref:Pollen-specific leucine-rich repeat extensin-like protein 4 n=1 Tax=Iris pallida TaxID=29817 RepID=A0AAX6GJY2_IRIPA|nr:pollen-specific leucine-rich repeat extensin-like protein 4 [Iris pallida]KAJ6830451.1 pollen-specific leucine-rich repeat extensin-like protein 4 [Iris pallida]
MATGSCSSTATVSNQSVAHTRHRQPLCGEPCAGPTPAPVVSGLRQP